MASRTVTKQDWSQWQGQLVAGKFPLTQFAGSSDHSGVFVTELNPGQKAALKLIAIDPGKAESYINRWKTVSKLSHSNLLRIFDFGKCELARQSFVYVVTEIAEENLAQVIPQRPLALDEAKPTLAATLEALKYLHSAGFVHGRLKPSNIMAVGEQLKVSVDGACEANKNCPAEAREAYSAPEYGSGMGSAADVWSLGMTLVEVLSQKLPLVNQGSDPHIPPTLPQPFFDIARHALRTDPQQRWSLEQIQQSLTPAKVSPAIEPAKPRSAVGEEPLRKRPRYLVPVLAIAALVVLLIAFAFTRGSRQASAPVEPAPSASTAASAPAVSTPEPKPNAGSGASRRTTVTATHSEPTSQTSGSGVRERATPAVAPSAMRTITGHFRIVVHANVDNSGNVTDANFKTRGPSQYFARLSMDAARQWKFSPPMVNGTPSASEWLIRFKFSRDGIDSSAEQVSP